MCGHRLLMLLMLLPLCRIYNAFHVDPATGANYAFASEDIPEKEAREHRYDLGGRQLLDRSQAGREIVLGGDSSDAMHCVKPTWEGHWAMATDPRPNAYFIMVGPFTRARKYKKWLYAVIAVASALKRHGSTADVVVLCAMKSGDGTRATPDEEALLSRNGINWRYVSAPYGNSGFHMGHYKLWAWQHTEYAKVQLLDADMLPLMNMDKLFHLDLPVESDFVGCPGKLSVLNAGWFVLRPSCWHFEAMTQLIKKDSSAFDREKVWGHALPYWVSAEGKTMKPGWDFFDAHGNQGHMYSYFLFDAKDLTFIYHGYKGPPRIMSYRNGSLSGGVDVLHDLSVRDPPKAAALHAEIYAAYPCPFPPVKDRAYYHFTGNIKPWTKWNPKNKQFQLWYDAVSASGDVSVQNDVFDGKILKE